MIFSIRFIHHYGFSAEVISASYTAVLTFSPSSQLIFVTKAISSVREREGGVGYGEEFVGKVMVRKSVLEPAIKAGHFGEGATKLEI